MFCVLKALRLNAKEKHLAPNCFEYSLRLGRAVCDIFCIRHQVFEFTGPQLLPRFLPCFI